MPMKKIKVEEEDIYRYTLCFLHVYALATCLSFLLYIPLLIIVTMSTSFHLMRKILQPSCKPPMALPLTPQLLLQLGHAIHLRQPKLQVLHSGAKTCTCHANVA